MFNNYIEERQCKEQNLWPINTVRSHSRVWAACIQRNKKETAVRMSIVRAAGVILGPSMDTVASWWPHTQKHRSTTFFSTALRSSRASTEMSPLSPPLVFSQPLVLLLRLLMWVWPMKCLHYLCWHQAVTFYRWWWHTVQSWFWILMCGARALATATSPCRPSPCRTGCWQHPLVVLKWSRAMSERWSLSSGSAVCSHMILLPPSWDA